MVPGQSATVLVAFAPIDGTPVDMRAGMVKKFPPPATALRVPAATEEPSRSETCAAVTVGSDE
jgi:hypothetical protein